MKRAITSTDRFGTLLALLAAAALAASLLALVKPAEAAFPGENGKIALVSDLDFSGFHEIYAANADGTGKTNLTNNPADDLDPSYSADGKRIAFASDRDGNQEVYAMDATGANPTRLTDNPARDFGPAFSPNGKIAFVSDRDGNQEIYTMDSDGANPTRLSNSPANEDDPAYSPDGSKIAFVSDRDGNSEIYVMDAAPESSTNQPRRLTDNPAYDGQPAWSPDGSRITFTSGRDGTNLEVYVMNADGPGQNIITEGADTSSDSGPAFSPDGQKIAFASYFSCEEGYCVAIVEGSISVMNADGSGRTAFGGSGVDFGPVDWGVRTPDATPPEDTAAPTGTVLINNGDDRTRTRSVTLTLSATDPSPGSGVTHMRIGNSQSGLASATWETYATSKLWTLSSGEGTKTVYVQYKDAAGNESAVAQDTIRYRR